ncbi:hypothetical protein BN1708_020534, partial [Verticillium longisporum]
LQGRRCLAPQVSVLLPRRRLPPLGRHDDAALRRRCPHRRRRHGFPEWHPHHHLGRRQHGHRRHARHASQLWLARPLPHQPGRV